MLTNWKRMKERRDQQIAFRYLHSRRAEFLEKYPQLCCLAFDHVSIVVGVHGRMDAGQLEWLRRTIGSQMADKVACDIGANLGNHTLAFAEFCKEVFAFEPQPLIFKLLQLNCRNSPSITALNFGLSDEAGTVVAAVDRAAFGSTHIVDKLDSDQSGCEFQVKQLDEVSELSGKCIGLLKIDVEGHEEQVIRGARKLLLRDAPAVVFEQNAPAIENGTSPAVELLRSFGYAHFCEPFKAESQRLSHRLRGRTATVARRAENLVLGASESVWSSRPITRFERRAYPWIVATKQPLTDA